MTIRRRRRLRFAPALVALLPLLGACSAAQSAVSGATSSAEQAARQKATDLAVQAFRSEVCSLTEDGRLSSSEVSKLRGALDTATAAGLPAQVVEQVRPLVEQSSSATKAQVKRLRAGVCTG